MRTLEWFWEIESISNGCNASFASLIPKVSNPISLGDFRPISFIGYFHKIVAKVLAERMKKVIEGRIKVRLWRVDLYWMGCWWQMIIMKWLKLKLTR